MKFGLSIFYRNINDIVKNILWADRRTILIVHYELIVINGNKINWTMNFRYTGIRGFSMDRRQDIA